MGHYYWHVAFRYRALSPVYVILILGIIARTLHSDIGHYYWHVEF